MGETYASLLSDGHRLSQVMAAQWQYLLNDPFRLPAHPAFVYGGRVNMRESNVVRVRRLGLGGRDRMQPRADGAAASVTDIARGYADVTVSPFALARKATDLAKLTDGLGEFDAALLAEDFFASYEGALVDLVANLLDTFGTPIGTSGSNLTLATFLAGKQVMEVANNRGPLLFIGHTQAVTDLQNDIATASQGAIQWQAQSGEFVSRAGGAYKGSFLETEIYQTSRAPSMNAGADVASAFLGAGAIAWADGISPLDFPSDQVYVGPVLMERNRDSLGAETTYVGHANMGVVELDDAAGLTIQSDAP
jgi:hypothetical protein